MTETFAIGERVELNGHALSQLGWKQSTGTFLGFVYEGTSGEVRWDNGGTTTIHPSWLRRPITQAMEMLRVAGHLEDDPCPLEC